MKKIILIALALVAFNINAQKSINEGIIVSSQTMSTNNEMLKPQLEAMGVIMSKTFFKGDKSRNETSSAMTGDMVVVIDGAVKQMLMMMNQPGLGKKYTTESTEPSEEDLQNISVTKGSETKTILGYPCEQYIVKMTQNGQELTLDMFTTEKISAISQNTTAMGDKIKGFPLYFSLHMKQMDADIKVETEVTEIIEETVSDDLFSLTAPEGFTKMN